MAIKTQFLSAEFNVVDGITSVSFTNGVDYNFPTANNQNTFVLVMNSMLTGGTGESLYSQYSQTLAWIDYTDISQSFDVKVLRVSTYHPVVKVNICIIHCDDINSPDGFEVIDFGVIANRNNPAYTPTLSTLDNVVPFITGLSYDYNSVYGAGYIFPLAYINSSTHRAEFKSYYSPSYTRYISYACVKFGSNWTIHNENFTHIQVNKLTTNFTEYDTYALPFLFDKTKTIVYSTNTHAETSTFVVVPSIVSLSNDGSNLELRHPYGTTHYYSVWLISHPDLVVEEVFYQINGTGNNGMYSFTHNLTNSYDTTSMGIFCQFSNVENYTYFSEGIPYFSNITSSSYTINVLNNKSKMLYLQTVDFSQVGISAPILQVISDIAELSESSIKSLITLLKIVKNMNINISCDIHYYLRLNRIVSNTTNIETNIVRNIDFIRIIPEFVDINQNNISSRILNRLLQQQLSLVDNTDYLKSMSVLLQENIELSMTYDLAFAYIRIVENKISLQESTVKQRYLVVLVNSYLNVVDNYVNSQRMIKIVVDNIEINNKIVYNRMLIRLFSDIVDIDDSLVINKYLTQIVGNSLNISEDLNMQLKVFKRVLINILLKTPKIKFRWLTDEV